MAGTDYIVSLSSPEHVNYINKLVLSNGEELPDPSPFQEMTTNQNVIKNMIQDLNHFIRFTK